MDAESVGSFGNLSASALFDLGGDEPTVVDEPVEEAKAEEEVSDDGVQGEGKEETSEEVKEEVTEEDSQEASEESDAPEESPSEEPEEPEVTRKKPFSIKTGEEEGKLSPKTQVQVVENGQKKFIPLADLVEGHLSKSQTQARYNEFKQEKEQFETEKNQTISQWRAQRAREQAEVQEFSQLVTNLAKSPNKIAALGEILDRVGEDPLTVVRDIRKSLVESAETYLRLSPEERRMLDYEEEVNYHKYKEQKRNEALAQERKRQEYQAQMQGAMAKHNIPSEKDFWSAYERLQAAKIAGTIQINEITPAAVGAFYEGEREGNHVREVVSKVNVEIVKDQTLMKKIYALYAELNPTDDELMEAVKAIAPESEKDTGSQPKAKLTTAKKPSKSEGTNKKVTKAADLFL